MKIIYWLPRVLSIGFVLFLSLFSFDVFSEYSGLSVVLPLLIHLVPSFVLLAAVLISWKHDLVGVTVFLGFAVFYVFMVGLNRPWSWYAGISGPAVALGILFLLSWARKRKTDRTTSPL
jgi:predicted neutral ceramidase superfamily lipid hydrolase